MVKLVSTEANITLTAAEKTVNALFVEIANTLKTEGVVTLPELGNLKIKSHAARTGRNPANGDPLVIPAKKVVKFCAKQSLNKSVN